MIKNKKLVAIIPVRKGSEGIKNKNLIKIGKKTLLERTIIIAKKNKYIDEIIVTTDCPKMHKIAKKYNVATKNLRPKYLSSSKALTVDVIKYVIKKYSIKNSYILLLQVTSPMRNIILTKKFLSNFHKNQKATSAVSVTLLEGYHPHKIQKIKNGWLKSLMGFESMVPRQYLPKCYYLNGLFYIAYSETILKINSFFSKCTLPFFIKKKYSLNIDEKNDLVILNYLKKKKLITKI
jgi:CMP-N,N'-diacetyllegionaminic acid synthase